MDIKRENMDESNMFKENINKEIFEESFWVSGPDSKFLGLSLSTRVYLFKNRSTFYSRGTINSDFF